VEIRDLDSWLVYRTMATGLVRGLAISDDGNWVAAAAAEVDVWDRRNGSHRQLSGHQGDASRVGFSPGGRLLASATFAGDVKVWEVASGREVRSFTTGHRGITSVAFSHDGRLLATGGSDETVRIWEAERPAAQALADIVKAREIRTADISEKVAMFEAFGIVAEEDGLDMLDGLLNGKGFLGKREPTEIRAAAALALGRIPGDHSRIALEKATQDDDPVVRSNVNRALRHEG
jgi:hypothetical protein